MTAASAVRAGRALAESLMVDTCTVRRKTGESTVAGVVTPTWEVVYSGRCRVQTYEPHESVGEVGGVLVTTQRYSVHVPVEAFEPAVGLVVAIDSCGLDAYLVGKWFQVVGLLHKSLATAYRLLVDEVPPVASTGEGGS